MSSQQMEQMRRIQDRLNIFAEEDFTLVEVFEALVDILEDCWTIDTRGWLPQDREGLVATGENVLGLASLYAQIVLGQVEPDLQTLRWRAPLLRKERKDDPLRLRMAIIDRDMDEFCLVDHITARSAQSVLNAASEILLGCAGIAMTSEYDNGMVIDMPAVHTARGPIAKAGMFKRVALVLCQLARYHSHWVTSDRSHAVKLWEQTVPGTGGTVYYQSAVGPQRSPFTLHKASNTGKRFATNNVQEQNWDMASIKLLAMLKVGMPKSDTELGACVYKAFDVITEACRSRADDSFGFVSYQYSTEMLRFAQQALTYITRCIDHFYNPAETSANYSEPFKVQPDQRKRPPRTEVLKLRRWATLTSLDVLYLTDPSDLQNSMVHFREVIGFSSGSQGMLKYHVGAHAGIATGRSGSSDVEHVWLPIVNNVRMEKKWRNEMRSFACHAAVGLAQSVSSVFGGEEVGLWGQSFRGGHGSRWWKNNV